jgi:predicted enzyme related to lactoylglutathione lyase
MKIKNRISTCFIHFKDLKKAKAWYKAVFPFEVDSEGDDFLSFKMEGTGLVLLQARNMDFNPLPYSVFFFETSDVDQVFLELTQKGVEMETGGIQSYSDGMFGCNIIDLEGNMLLICTPSLTSLR